MSWPNPLKRPHRAIISTGPYHYLLISLIFVFTYYISIDNSMFWCLIFWDWMYYWWYIIHRHQFLFKLGIFLFPLLTNSYVFFESMWFLLYDSDSKACGLFEVVTQEVPLPPCFSIALATLRAMFSLVRGRVEEGSFVINAKLFWQFICFLLNF